MRSSQQITFVDLLQYHTVLSHQSPQDSWSVLYLLSVLLHLRLGNVNGIQDYRSPLA